MNLLDLIILATIAYCLIRGIFRGLIKEIASIVGVLAAFYAGYSYYPSVAGLLDRWITNPGYLNILSFFILFSTVFLVISILGVVIKYLLNIAFLGWVDRLCGAAFGILKGTLIVAVLLVALTAFLQRGTPFIRDSLLAPHAMLLSQKMAKVVPQNMKAEFLEGIEALERAWR